LKLYLISQSFAEIQFLTHLRSTRSRVNYHILYFAIISRLTFYVSLGRSKTYTRQVCNFMQSSALIKETRKTSTLRFLLTWLLYLHFIPSHSLLHYAYHMVHWTAMQLCANTYKKNSKKRYSLRKRCRKIKKEKVREKN